MPAHDLTILPVDYKRVVGHPNYVVGSDGSVWSASRRRKSKVMRLKTGTRGDSKYEQVLLSIYPKYQCMLIHRLILETFVGPCPPGMQCRHIDGNPKNNWLDNLAWGTAKQNSRDRITHGTQTRGKTNGNSKLTEAEVREIRRLIAQGLNNCEIGRRFGVSYTPIRAIRLGETWRHIQLHES